jgi:hypothetical protein
MKPMQEQAAWWLGHHTGRGERIRTSGLYVPNVALYQAKLHPDFVATAGFGSNHEQYNQRLTAT